MTGPELHVEVDGPDSGVPVVLGHSLGTDLSLWADQVEALSTDHRVVRFDFPGHGRSAPPLGSCSIAGLAGIVIEAIDAAGVDRFHYCGISMGGQVGLRLAIDHPDRVRSLTVANTAARIGSPAGWRDRIDRVRAVGMAAIAEDVAGSWVSDAFAGRHPDRYRSLIEGLARTSPAGYMACCDALAAADLTADLGSIGVPTTIIGGTADVSTPMADAVELRDAIPDSRLVEIEGAAHLSNLDAPAAFADALLDRLRSA